MRILVLHSDVNAGAAPDDLDTLATAEAVASALRGRGHRVALAAFAGPVEHVRGLVQGIDAVFNLVETVEGADSLAATAPFMLDELGARYSGSGGASIALAGDKILAKRVLRSAGLPTPDWAEPPHFSAAEEKSYIVKSVTEDASIGLDDGAVVQGRDAVVARARQSAERHGGRWFAEAYVEGREFNVALIEENGAWRTLPVAEIRFKDWPRQKPRIVGYRAKWDESSSECENTVRAFGLEDDAPGLASELTGHARRAAALFGVKGYARVDFRVDVGGRPTILEINPNPCLAPDAGYAAAAAEAGIPFAALIERLLPAASRMTADMPVRQAARVNTNSRG